MATTTRYVRHLFVMADETVQLPGGKTRVARRSVERGKALEVTPEEEARLDSLGALEDKGYQPPTGIPEVPEDPPADPVVAVGDGFSPIGASADDLDAWLKGDGGTAPSVPTILQAVGDDAATARMVLSAEDRVNDGDPRKTLVDGLTPVAGRA